jgi:nucleotide-binding universal stress UspA family protein
MYKTILVPLDGSKRAEAILGHVEELARHYNAKVIFLHVIEPTFMMGPEGTEMELYQQEIKQQTEQAESYLAAVQGEFREKNIKARMRMAYGPAVGAIIETAKNENADIIAIASHGRSGLSQVFYGSVAAGVLHRIDRPLLLIRSLEKE